MSITQKSLIKSLIITTLAFSAFFFASNAFAAIIAVDSNTGDATADGECNLEEAIASVNAAANIGDCAAVIAEPYGTNDTIVFTIGLTDDTQIITGSDSSYDITAPITIDGLTQGSDASCGIEEDLSDRDLDVELQGIELRFQAGSDGSSIQGLSILGMDDRNAITIEDTDGFDLTCSNIGIDASGTSANVTRHSLVGTHDSDNVTIGSAGLEIATTNIFAGGNSDPNREALIITNVNDFSVYGNWFGKGIGPSFNEFPAEAEFVDIYCPTVCGPGDDYSTNVIIEGNDFTGDDVMGTGIQLNGIEGLLVKDNLFEGIFGAGLSVKESLNAEILDNNIINGSGSGMNIQLSDNVVIKGNNIGVDETGLVSASIGYELTEGRRNVGIVLLGSTNVTIGGDQSADRNIISGNDSENFSHSIAVYPDLTGSFTPSENVTIQGNYIGVAADGVTPLSNSNAIGIVASSEDILIGGLNESEYNIIQGGTVGVSILAFQAPLISRDVSVLGNKIYNNNGNAVDIAVDSVFDLSADILVGPNSNDVGDTDEGPYIGLNPGNDLNHLLNYPEFTSYETDTTTTDIEYILDVPAGDYRIEFFQNSILTDYGEGETFLTSQDITHAGSGQETFTINLEVEVGDYIAATATERNQLTTSTFGATSEFSASATIEAMAEEVTRRRSSSSTASSRATATQAFNAYYGTTTENSSNNNSSDEGSALGSGQCPANLIVTQNLRQGARDGQFHSYTGGTVEEVALVQQHINRIFAAYFAQAAGPVDGIYGPLTEQGVVRLQETLQDEQGADLGPGGTDGIVGPMTRDAINGSCGEMEE